MHALLPHTSHLISVGICNFSADEAPVLEKHRNKIKIHWTGYSYRNASIGLLRAA